MSPCVLSCLQHKNANNSIAKVLLVCLSHTHTHSADIHIHTFYYLLATQIVVVLVVWLIALMQAGRLLSTFNTTNTQCALPTNVRVCVCFVRLSSAQTCPARPFVYLLKQQIGCIDEVVEPHKSCCLSIQPFGSSPALNTSPSLSCTLSKFTYFWRCAALLPTFHRSPQVVLLTHCTCCLQLKFVAAAVVVFLQLFC